MLKIYLQPYNPYISNYLRPQLVGRNYAGTHDDGTAMPKSVALWMGVSIHNAVKRPKGAVKIELYEVHHDELLCSCLFM